MQFTRFYQVANTVAGDGRLEGLVVGIARRRQLALLLLGRYAGFTESQRAAAIVLMASSLRVAAPAASELERLLRGPHDALREALTPPYERFFALVASVPQGVEFLLQFRDHVLSVLSRYERAERGGPAVQGGDATSSGARFGTAR